MDALAKLTTNEHVWFHGTACRHVESVVGHLLRLNTDGDFGGHYDNWGSAYLGNDILLACRRGLQDRVRPGDAAVLVYDSPRPFAPVFQLRSEDRYCRFIQISRRAGRDLRSFQQMAVSSLMQLVPDLKQREYIMGRMADRLSWDDESWPSFRLFPETIVQLAVKSDELATEFDNHFGALYFCAASRRQAAARSFTETFAPRRSRGSSPYDCVLPYCYLRLKKPVSHSLSDESFAQGGLGRLLYR